MNTFGDWSGEVMELCQNCSTSGLTAGNTRR